MAEENKNEELQEMLDAEQRRETRIKDKEHHPDQQNRMKSTENQRR